MELRSAFQTLLALFLPFVISCSQAPETSGLHDEPVFYSKSKEPVTLLLKFTEGEKFKTSGNETIKTTIDLDFHKQKVEIDVDMDMDYQILSVDTSNNAQIEMRVQRIRMRIDSGNGSVITVDSDYPESITPGVEFLLAIVRVPITIKVSNTGKILEINTTDAEVMMENAYAAKQTIDDMMAMIKQHAEQSFILMPVEPIKAGDSFKGISVNREIVGFSSYTIKPKYYVGAISGDQKQVLLIIKNDTDIKVFDSDIHVDVKEIETNGWALVSTDTGRITSSSEETSISVEMSNTDMTGQTTIEMRSRITESH